jgi:hypothetical protein
VWERYRMAGPGTSSGRAYTAGALYGKRSERERWPTSALLGAAPCSCLDIRAARGVRCSVPVGAAGRSNSPWKNEPAYLVLYLLAGAPGSDIAARIEFERPDY